MGNAVVNPDIYEQKLTRESGGIYVLWLTAKGNNKEVGQYDLHATAVCDKTLGMYIVTEIMVAVEHGVIGTLPFELLF